MKTLTELQIGCRSLAAWLSLQEKSKMVGIDTYMKLFQKIAKLTLFL